MARRTRTKVNKILPVLSLLLLCSCEGVLFHEFRPAGKSGWNRFDTLEFVYDKSLVKDTAVLISVDTRTAASYPYKDIIVAIEVLDTTGAVFSKDTLSCPVYYDDGRRRGHTAGILYQQSGEPAEIDLPHQKNMLHVTHLMADTLLKGVYDIGIKIRHRD